MLCGRSLQGLSPAGTDEPLFILQSADGAGAARRMKPKIIFLVTEDWFFWSHRLPMALAARQAGFDVGVATRVVEWGDRIRAEGFALHELTWTRGSLSLLDNLGVVWDLVRLYAREKPDIVHHVALKPVVMGNVAAAVARVPRV